MANGLVAVSPLYEDDAKNSRWSIFVGLFFIAVFSVASWFLAPKGENQT
jgi:hypothetical protein